MALAAVHTRCITLLSGPPRRAERAGAQRCTACAASAASARVERVSHVSEHGGSSRSLLSDSVSVACVGERVSGESCAVRRANFIKTTVLQRSLQVQLHSQPHASVRPRAACGVCPMDSHPQLVRVTCRRKVGLDSRGSDT